MSPATQRLVNFLGELGSRWGLPERACRLHGYLYLVARPVEEAELQEELAFTDHGFVEALNWLSDYKLVARTGTAWRTGSDPWELMLRALEERRRRELAPALELLRNCQREANDDDGGERAVPPQIGKLLALAEDIAAIDMQARRLSPHTLRQLIGFGGRAARFVDRTFGKGSRE